MAELPVFEQYPVRIFDNTLNWIAEYNDYENLLWVRRWRRAGEFSLRISRYFYNSETKVIEERDLQKGYYVSIHRGGEDRIGRITRRNIGLSESGMESEIWTVSGPDGKGLLESRKAIAGIAAGTGYDVQTAQPAETAIRYYIDRNVITPKKEDGTTADSNRTISEFELETPDGAKGGNITYQARLQSLPDLIEEILLASTGIGYEVEFVRSTKKLQVKIKAGTDRSATVQYNTKFGNIRATDYEDSDDGVTNFVYAMGTGTANSRKVLSYPSSSIPTGLDRYEGFIDGSQTDDSDAQLTDLAKAEIADKGSAESLTFEIIQDNSFHYMSRDAAGDFDMGDIITAVYYGIATLSGRIIEVRETYGKSAAGRISLTTGTEIPDNTKIIKSVNNRAITRGRA
jgi:hypothetical protein